MISRCLDTLFHPSSWNPLLSNVNSSFVRQQIVMMLDNVLYVSKPEDYIVIANDTELISALNWTASKILEEDSEVKDMVVLCGTLLGDSKLLQQDRISEIHNSKVLLCG